MENKIKDIVSIFNLVTAPIIVFEGQEPIFFNKRAKSYLALNSLDLEEFKLLEITLDDLVGEKQRPSIKKLDSMEDIELRDVKSKLITNLFALNGKMLSAVSSSCQFGKEDCKYTIITLYDVSTYQYSNLINDQVQFWKSCASSSALKLIDYKKEELCKEDCVDISTCIDDLIEYCDVAVSKATKIKIKNSSSAIANITEYSLLKTLLQLVVYHTKDQPFIEEIYIDTVVPHLSEGEMKEFNYIKICISSRITTSVKEAFPTDILEAHRTRYNQKAKSSAAKADQKPSRYGWPSDIDDIALKYNLIINERVNEEKKLKITDVLVPLK